VKSHAELRAILQEYEKDKGGIFGRGEVVQDGSNKGLYEGLGDTGTAMVMNIEMSRELQADAAAGAKEKKGGGKGKGGGAKKPAGKKK
jgi:hypothetical protein